MRYLFRRTIPDARRVLLVESGPRALTDRFFPVFRKVFGDAVVDVFSCLPVPDERQASGFRRSYRSQDAMSRQQRSALLAELRRNDYQAMVIYCANSPLLFRWKWWLALRLPVKVLITNENADCYWLDVGHWRNAKSMVGERFGLRGAGSFRTVGEVILFPLVVSYLLVYAGAVHLRRQWRLWFGGQRQSRVS